jgi:uncharacterized protein (TIGR02996 family)
MNDRQALLRAIVEARDDDAPRLVYADWLDEHGDAERAEFIRLQCTIHGTPMPDDQWKAAVARCDALLAANEARWMKGVPGPPAVEWISRYYRGFRRHGGAARWADLRDVWEPLFATTPLMQLTIRAIAPRELDDFLARPETRFLQYVFLTVDGRVDQAAARLARDPAVAGWSVLELRPPEDDELTGFGAEALAKSPYLGGLHRLHLPTAALNPEARLALKVRFPEALT